MESSQSTTALPSHSTNTSENLMIDRNSHSDDDEFIPMDRRVLPVTTGPETPNILDAKAQKPSGEIVTPDGGLIAPGNHNFKLIGKKVHLDVEKFNELIEDLSRLSQTVIQYGAVIERLPQAFLVALGYAPDYQIKDDELDLIHRISEGNKWALFADNVPEEIKNLPTHHNPLPDPDAPVSPTLDSIDPPEPPVG